MAQFGTPFASGWGSPSNMVEAVRRRDPVRGGSTFPLAFLPRSGWGDAFFQIYRDAKYIATVLVAEGVFTDEMSIPLERTSDGKQSILILRVGHLPGSALLFLPVARYQEIPNSRRASIPWTWVPEDSGATGEGGHTSAWALAGITRLNTRRVAYAKTWGELDVDILVSGGNATVTVYNGNSGTLCSGTGAFPGTITLAEQNSSGVSGTVALDAGAITATGALLTFRWPYSMTVLRGITDPPTAVVATVLFDGLDAALWTEDADLAAGTYYYRLRPISDTGDLGTVTATLHDYFTGLPGIIIPGPPEPPTNLAYFSGNAAATVLHFTGSTTPGATYRLYLQQIGSTQPINFNNIAATAAALATSITVPALAGFPGKARVVLRAVNGGVEDGNVQMLDLEYGAAGAFVTARPNTPSLVEPSIIVTSGRTLGVRGVYPTFNELATATKLQIFFRAPTGSYNFAAPAAEATLGSISNGLKTATLSYTFVANGFYYVILKAATVTGVQSEVSSNEALVYVSDVDAPAPTDAFVAVSRG